MVKNAQWWRSHWSRPDQENCHFDTFLLINLEKKILLVFEVVQVDLNTGR
jgi:hypothetical protein